MKIKVQLFFLLGYTFGHAQTGVDLRNTTTESERHITVESGSYKYSKLVEDPNFIHDVVEIMAEPKQGIFKYRQELVLKMKQSKQPLPSPKNRAMIRFVVEKDGSLTDLKVLRESTEGLGKELIQLLVTEKWKPATLRGEVVRSSFVLPITIDTNEKNNN